MPNLIKQELRAAHDRKRLVNRCRGRRWTCAVGGLLKSAQGKSPVASCGEAIRSAG